MNVKLPEFNNEEIQSLVFTHRSYLNENREVKESNERLEFLGDSILSFVVSSYIYNQYPNLKEGELTSLRSVLTNTQTLYLVSDALGLGSLLKMSKGEEDGGGRTNKTILANTYEAAVGGLFLDSGIEKAREFIITTILDNANEFIGAQGLKDSKSMLQEFMQEKYKVSPDYRILGEEGPDHNKIYTSGVFLNGELVAQGQGRSKQEAEKDAAQKAVSVLHGENQ
jgi:ribonuclease-3